MMNMKRFAIIVLIGLVSCFGYEPSCAQPVVGLDRGPQPPHLLKDQPVEAYRLELLGLAWQAAASYPIDPHIKNRARAEEQVVHGALQIGQPHLAWGYAKQVVNWRRGACYAEVAHYLLDQDDAEHVAYFLQQALLHSKDPNQGWRHARVKARVAEARVRMGEPASAEGLNESDDAEAQGRRLAAEAALASEEDFDRLVAGLDSLVTSEGYDAILAALNGYADLYRRFYTNPQRRGLMLAKSRVAWRNMPALKRFEMLLLFADAALEHDDRANAKRLIDEADGVRRSYSWAVDNELPLRAELSGYRFALGDADAARALLDEAVALADDKLNGLQNFNRADALRPVAQGYATLGDLQTAHRLYRRVVELGAINPNLRPRISDFTATCVSMAVYGIEPDAELCNTLKEIVTGLSNP